MAKNPLCPMNTNNCAACHNNACFALIDTDFGAKPCPFYRSKEAQAAANKRCLEQLRERGRLDLIEMYYVENI